MFLNAGPNFGYNIKSILSMFACLSLLAGCAIQLVSSYDEKTDEAVTALQKKFETFFVTVGDQYGLPECKYANHQKFYQEAKVDISAIDVRARAIPDNGKTAEQVSLLGASLESLEKLHKISCFTDEQVDNLRSSFNSSITAILTLELAKKRGE